MTGDPTPKFVQAIAIGGVADGYLIEQLDLNRAGQQVKLQQPEHLKPLKSSKQKQPDVVMKSDFYDVHILRFMNGPTEMQHFALLVVSGQTLSWGFSQLVISHVAKAHEAAMATKQ